ncbi:MAG: Maf family protein [Erysipelotrichaceae bacterium]
MKRILLASESPRRRELFMKMDIPFFSKGAWIEETLDASLPIEQAVAKIAKEKAEALLVKNPEEWVVGADTVVVLDGEVMGKPRNEEEAFAMLRKLSGKTHQVITGVAILSATHQETFYSVTDVTFYPLDEDQIHQYIKSKEPFDKAGAYGIQGNGALFVAKISGDYYNVVGLPISMLYRKLLPLLKMD